MATIEERALALVNEVTDQAKRGSFPGRLLPDADAIVLAEALCRALAGIALGMVSILCLYAFTEKLK